MLNNNPEHKDKLGQSIDLDDFVAYPSHNSLDIGKVIKLNNKMVKVLRIPAGRNIKGTNKYPNDMVKVDPKDVTVYLLKNSK